MEKQMNLFEAVASYEHERKEASLFQKWKELPNPKVILDTDPERSALVSMMRGDGWKLYRRAQHVCETMPSEKYIWLNDIEAPEFWVMNEKGNPGGELVETCPFCGADLKNRRGDVVLLKTDSSYWKRKGFLA